MTSQSTELALRPFHTGFAGRLLKTLSIQAVIPAVLCFVYAHRPRLHLHPFGAVGPIKKHLLVCVIKEVCGHVAQMIAVDYFCHWMTPRELIWGGYMAAG